jgi:hypothetical protein
MNRGNSGRRCLRLAEWRFAVAKQDRNHLTWMESIGRRMAINMLSPSKHAMHKIAYMILLVVTVSPSALHSGLSVSEEEDEREDLLGVKRIYWEDK